MQDAVMIFEQIRPWVMHLSDTERLRLIRAIAGVNSEGFSLSTTISPQRAEPEIEESRADESLDETAQQLLIEQESWYHRPQTEKARYQNEFVALYGGEVVDHDTQRLVLLRRIRQKFGQAPVAILPAAQNAVPEYIIHHPQVAV